MKAPDASVIVPTRNRCRQLQLALKSALAQRDCVVEVLIVDDGSTDLTERWASSISDPHVRYLRLRAPQGVSAARNVGIAEARARWIAFLDDDDVWAPTKVARQIREMVLRRRHWSYAGEVMVDADLNVLGGGPPPPPDVVVRQLERHNSVPAGASNVVVDAEALSTVGPFDPELTINEDWDMWIRLGRWGPPASVRSPLVAISYHDGNASRDTAEMLRQLGVVARRHGIRIDWARHYRWAAWLALEDGRRVEALRHYARAVAAGDFGSLGRAGIAIVRPGSAISRRRSSDARLGQDPWIAEARAWLHELAQAGRDSCGKG